MELSQYQRYTKETALYDENIRIALAERSLPEWESWLTVAYCAGKLNGEAGEVAEEVFKALRDDYGVVTPERREKLIKEIGDVMWYVAQICESLALDMDIVGYLNLKKLRERKVTGNLQGSGSDR